MYYVSGATPISGFVLIFTIDKIDQRRKCLVERDGRNVSGL